MLTMLLGGLWHGANYTFIVWGAIHGGALVMEHVLGGRQLRARHGIWSLQAVAGWAYTFLVVFVAWVLFRAADVGQANQIVAAMFSPARLAFSAVSLEIRQIAFFVAVLTLTQWPMEWLLGQLRRERIAPGVAVAVAFWSLVGAVVLGAPVAVPFIYFQF